MNPEVLVELKGKTVIKFDNDARTILDRNGNRWITGDSSPELRKITKPILQEIEKYMQKNHSDYFESYIWNSNPFINSETIYEVIEDVFSGKDKRNFLKWYFKMVKKYVNKEMLNMIMKNDMHRTDFDNDEILLHDYEVVNWWFYEDKDYEIYGTTILDDTDIDKFMLSDFETYKEYIKKYHFDDFIQWRIDIQKKYPGLCSNYITIADVMFDINVNKNKYHKCKK
jgi:hypothetical protein